MRKWHLIIDVERCEDCNNCFLACKDEHVDNEWSGYSLAQPRHGQRWINIMRQERGQYPLIDIAYRPTTCMHCDNAPCIKASEGAISKRPDGIVIIDPQKAKGKKELIDGCPYQMVWWNEELDVPQKCTLCAHLLDEGWKQPRCVQVCPTGALRVEFVDEIEMSKIRETEKLEVLHPEFNTSPNVYYKNMYRFDRWFIAGSIEIENNGVIDCAEGALVKLYHGEKQINETVTDNYGDFKIDQLIAHSGQYSIQISARDYRNKQFDINLDKSINLGNIRLERE